MGHLLDEHNGWTREDLDRMFGPHPDHASAPTRAELAAELEAELASDVNEPTFDWPTDDLDEDEPSLMGWTSLSDKEIRSRVAEELGYPYSLAITSHRVGGSAMVMIMMHGPSGKTISV